MSTLRFIIPCTVLFLSACSSNHNNKQPGQDKKAAVAAATAVATALLRKVSRSLISNLQKPLLIF